MSVFIEAVPCENNRVKINLESLLIIYVYKVCDTNNISLHVVYKECIQEPVFGTDLSQVNFNICNVVHIPRVAQYCIWPVIVLDNDVIAGLCSVARKIIELSEDEKIKSLLGFKNACLLACSESSIWTKFCEVDMPAIVRHVLINTQEYIKDKRIFLPSELIKFEYHMQRPVRMHNIYKVARERHCNKAIKSSVPVEDLNLAHIYSEGLYMTLADVLLYPCIQILFNIFSIHLLENTIPLSITWYQNIQSNLPETCFDIDIIDIDYTKIANVIYEHVPKESLYTSDHNRYRPQSRMFTKQFDIEASLNVIHNSCIELVNNILPFGVDMEFDWCKIPLDANPEGGALPKKRATRKCEQLENLTKAVIKIVDDKEHVIVDFCSGSGHLGILLAVLLPKCEIILVENKQKSLIRAKERIRRLNLKNVYIVQCNLDYFKAKFDIGVSLHACGVATDLVIQNCIDNRAHFVCCPCCYGGIHDCHHLKYPRSVEFLQRNISTKDYLSIAHAADQTHDDENLKTKQGFFCMDVIDNDRKLMAESHGYTVHLGKLQPISCTPKNNLLVGLCKGNCT